MLDLHALITNFLMKWNQEAYILLRVEFTTGLLIVLYTMMFVLAIARFSAAGSTSILNLLDVVSDSILVYILGTMQAAPFKNQLFPVWGLALVTFRSCVNCLSSYGTYAELRNMLKLSAVAYMNVTHDSNNRRTLFWTYWSLLVLKSVSRIVARYQASKSWWHGRSSEFLQEYMGGDSDQSTFAPHLDDCNPETMEGYRYVVFGGRKTGRSLIMDSSRLITLEKIWRINGPLVRPVNRQGNNMKDLCLAFALSRLLRCRLDGATLNVALVTMTRKLICAQILAGKNADKAFGILAMDIAFLNDNLHTSHPMVFSEGLLSLYITDLQNTMRFGMAFWMCGSLYGSLVRKELPIRSDVLITGITFLFASFMEVLESLTYWLSDWLALVCACQYARGANLNRRVLVLCASFLSRLNISKQSVGTIGQYAFLQSFNYSTWKWQLVHLLTMGVVASKGDGTKLSDAIKLPQNVKVKVFEALGSLCSRNLDGHFLPRDFTLPWTAEDLLTEQYWLTCLRLPICSHVILVWHIATSLCEMKLAQDHGIDLSNPGCLRSSLSFLTKWYNCSQHYLLDEKSLDGGIRINYEVANSLSQYCAYLLVSKPDLLPDTILVPKVLLHKTVLHALEMLKGCDSLQSIYDKLIAVPLEEPSVQGSHHRKLSVNILEEGARLGKKLIGEEHCWEVLAKVWVNLLIHIAPSNNAEAHAKYLESGSEFVSLIWALFCHFGIKKSELWQEGAASGNNSSGPSQQNRGVSATRVQQTVASGPPDGQASDVLRDLEGGHDMGEIMEASPTRLGRC